MKVADGPRGSKSVLKLIDLELWLWRVDFQEKLSLLGGYPGCPELMARRQGRFWLFWWLVDPTLLSG